MKKSSKLPILIVEDYQDASDCLAALFNTHGYKVDQALDIREAVALFNSRCSDNAMCYGAAIVDVHLPSASGLGFMRAVRQARSKLPVFAVTAYDDGYIRDRVEHEGARYFTKPVDPVFFIKTVLESAQEYVATRPHIESHPPLTLDACILEIMNRVENATK